MNKSSHPLGFFFWQWLVFSKKDGFSPGDCLFFQKWAHFSQPFLHFWAGPSISFSNKRFFQKNAAFLLTSPCFAEKVSSFPSEMDRFPEKFRHFSFEMHSAIKKWMNKQCVLPLFFIYVNKNQFLFVSIYRRFRN